MANRFFNYSDLSDFINRTQVVIAKPEGYAVIVIHYSEDIPITLPGFRADPKLTDFQIKEAGYNFWELLNNSIYKGKQTAKISHRFDPEKNDNIKGTLGIIKTHFPIDIGDIDFAFSDKYREAIKNGLKPVQYVNINDAESTQNQPLTPGDCFKLRDCPACKQITAQEQKLYDPDDPGAGFVWYCTKCKENIDIV